MERPFLCGQPHYQGLVLPCSLLAHRACQFDVDASLTELRGSFKSVVLCVFLCNVVGVVAVRQVRIGEG